MPDDVRELLRIGAGEAHDLPDTGYFWQQGRRRVWWRRAVGTVAVLAVVAIAVAGRSWFPLPGGEVQPTDRPARGDVSIPLRIGQLEPGSYEAGDWSLPFVLAPLDDSWRVVELDDDWISLVRGPDTLQIARLRSVIEPSAQRWGPDVVEPAPADLAGWIVEHPRLETTSEATSLGGLPAVRIQARAVRTIDPGPASCVGRPCVPLAQLGSASAYLSIAASERATLYVVGEDDPVVISYSARPDRFEALGDAAEQLLRSLRFVERR
jgi:hypothetical protein